jgi:hypothetical protein
MHTKFESENGNVRMASMKVSYHTAREGHAVGENLVKPCAIDLAVCMADDNLAVLLVFVRCVSKGEFQEDLILCKSTEAQKTGDDIFKILDQFL